MNRRTHRQSWEQYRAKQEQLRQQLIEEFPNVFTKNSHLDIPIGWFGVVKEAVHRLSLLPPKRRQHQIISITRPRYRTKGLRLRVDKQSSAIKSIIDEVVCDARYSCLVCGKLGTDHGSTGWGRPLCAQHAVQEFNRNLSAVKQNLH